MKAQQFIQPLSHQWASRLFLGFDIINNTAANNAVHVYFPSCWGW